LSTSAPAAPAAPAASPSTGQGSQGTQQTQPGATGQGQGQAQGTANQGGFNWGLFPNVPEGQRELLQPHLTNVMGHVTRMEQQYAPYKGLTDAIPPDQVQGLLGFLNNYSSDPVNTWLGLAQTLVENGTISNPAFNVEQLQAMISGQAPVDPSMMGQQGQMGQAGQEEIPPWAQEMQAKLQQYEQQEQTRQQAAQAAQEAQVLGEAHAAMREQLQAAGLPQDLISEEQMTAALIVHQGDINAAVGSFTGLREGLLGGFVAQNGQGPGQPRVNGELNVPSTGIKGGKGKDAFRQASIGAQQMLAQNAAAQGQ
jgi:hypothetical protein